MMNLYSDIYQVKSILHLSKNIVQLEIFCQTRFLLTKLKKKEK